MDLQCLSRYRDWQHPPRAPFLAAADVTFRDREINKRMPIPSLTKSEISRGYERPICLPNRLRNGASQTHLFNLPCLHRLRRPAMSQCRLH